MNYRLRISARAQGDIEAIYNYILKDSEAIAKKQAEMIYSSLENLQHFPEMGAHLSSYTVEKNDYRFISIKKTYVVFYKLANDEVRVIRIFRGEQDYLRQLGIK